MKKVFYVLAVVLLASCKKEETVNVQPLQAQSLQDVSYGSNASQTLDVYLPAGRNADSTRLLVLVHGGAWISGDKSDFTSFIPLIKQRFPGYAIANINYRLANAGANHFPTQENDMKSAIEFLVQKSGDYHISKKLILIGASAGAHMTLLQAYKYSSPRIQAVVDFFGPTDMTDLYAFYAPYPVQQSLFKTFLKGTPTGNASLYAQSSPLNFVTTQSSPTIIFHGTADDVVPASQSIALKNKLSSLGVAVQLTSYTNLGHGVWPAEIMNDAYNKMELFLKMYVH